MPIFSRYAFMQLFRSATLAPAASKFPRLQRPRRGGSTPLSHVVVSCQENRSFDHYYGFAPFADAFGIPSGYNQPDGRGGYVTPHHLRTVHADDPAHGWADIHAEWDRGKMDGFYTADGARALGYYDETDLPFYYELFASSTLCGNYFCSVLGPTWPNRLYLASGTSGGNTTNSIRHASLRWPTITHLLDRYGVTWKAYNFPRPVPYGQGGDNVFDLFEGLAQDPRAHASEADYVADLRGDTFPNVAFVMPGDDSTSEHPPYSIHIGQRYQKRLIGLLQASRYWATSAYLLTYDEAGGFFDHVSPPVFDAYGAGIRVPMWIVSPFAKPMNVQGTLYEHSSVLKFLERVFDLPTLASINHRFDARTPGKNNDAANGHAHGPAAPPRDGIAAIGDLIDCLTL